MVRDDPIGLRGCVEHATALSELGSNHRTVERQTSHRATVTQCGQVLLAARIRVDLVGPANNPTPVRMVTPAAHPTGPERPRCADVFVRNLGTYSAQLLAQLA
jgi:hypothetical protein